MASLRFARGALAWERWGLLLTVLLALALRLVWLDHIPGNVTADEADNLGALFRIQETGRPTLFGLDWKPQPAFSLYLALPLMELLGSSVFSLRLVSATLSSLALVPFYALARRAASAPAALAATVLLASGRWYLHFSRSGWENVHTALYALLGAWALTVALERQAWRWFALAGVAAALGLYGYFSGRLILPALLLVAPFALRREPQHRRRLAAGFLILAVTAIVLFLPQLPAVFGPDGERFNRRVEAVSVLGQPRPYLGQETAAGILAVQLHRTLAGFLGLDGALFTKGRYGPVGEPLYDRVTGILFLVGLGAGALAWRRTAVWWSLLLVPLLVTQVLGVGTPDGARAVTVAPFVYLFLALGLETLVRLVPPRAALPAVAVPALAVLAVWLAAVNVHGYFSWIRTPMALQARQPAVSLGEFPAWQADLRAELRRGGQGFTVHEWRARRS